MKSMRRAAGLVAALLLVLLGIACLQGTLLPIGIALIAVSGAATFYQIRALRATREDPYDLKRLFDPPPVVDSPEDDSPTDEDESVPFCHHCGHAVSAPFARCPECGSSVR